MDDKLRKLERLASQGDIEAMGKLHLERYRLGLPLLPSIIKNVGGDIHYYFLFANGLVASMGDFSSGISVMDWEEFDFIENCVHRVGPFGETVFINAPTMEEAVMHPDAQEYLVKMMLYGR